MQIAAPLYRFILSCLMLMGAATGVASGQYSDGDLTGRRIIAALVSWGIALFEYLLQVPANRIGYQSMDLGQLKILQEAITLSVFVPFAFFYMKQPLKLDYLWAALCLCGAVYFIFRN